MKNLLIILIELTIIIGLATAVNSQTNAVNEVSIEVKYIDVESFSWISTELNGYVYYIGSGKPILKTVKYTFKPVETQTNRETCIIETLEKHLPQQVINDTDIITPENQIQRKSLIISSVKHKKHFLNKQILQELSTCGEIEISLRIGGRQASKWINEKLESPQGEEIINHLITTAETIFETSPTWIYIVDDRDITVEIPAENISQTQVTKYLAKAREEIPTYTPIILKIEKITSTDPATEPVDTPEQPTQTPAENTYENNIETTGDVDTTPQHIIYAILTAAAAATLPYIIKARNKKQ